MPDVIELRVIAVVEETRDARTFVLQAADPLEYRPGQFLTVAVPVDATRTVARCYSMSSAPHEDQVRITVKRTPDGYASNWLCDNIAAGSSIKALPPTGVFTPTSTDVDLLLFAAGSGITPVMSIAKDALEHGKRNVVLFYANRDVESVIFADEICALSAAYPDRLLVMHWLESLQSLPSTEQIQGVASHFMDHDVFTCGPAPFMSIVGEALTTLGFPQDRVHKEVFRSLSGDPFALDGTPGHAEMSASRSRTVSVSGERGGTRFSFDDWPVDIPLLDFLLSKGVPAPYSCRSAECGACCFKVVRGEVEMSANDVLDEGELGEGYRLACQSRPATPTVEISYD